MFRQGRTRDTRITPREVEHPTSGPLTLRWRAASERASSTLLRLRVSGHPCHCRLVRWHRLPRRQRRSRPGRRSRLHRRPRRPRHPPWSSRLLPPLNSCLRQPLSPRPRSRGRPSRRRHHRSRRLPLRRRPQTCRPPTHLHRPTASPSPDSSPSSRRPPHLSHHRSMSCRRAPCRPSTDACLPPAVAPCRLSWAAHRRHRHPSLTTTPPPAPCYPPVRPP
mmetsp:Transcript_17121/g.43990  ORF Transcript_17121/g.43990 Transcript_17121/m.43990 type:complete len:220 (+) Transcript_17121:460-1119(+)